ncbi:MAG: 5'-3' exonuclease H3TH domain-containing protein [bacterium]|nr:5'-3' exonuclease H3TH domain-containing protein [bacterium]
MQRLILIDGNAILHRAYHALPPLTNRSGELVNAVYGFSTMLLKVIGDLKPSFIVVAFDTSKPTFRKMEYLGYQSNRPAMDEELSGQIEKVHEMVRAFEIPIYSVPGFEADDVIGTLARQAVEGLGVRGQRLVKKPPKPSPLIAVRSPLEVIIVTGDKDIMQLVGSKVKIYAPVKGMSEAELFDEKKVAEKLGVAPSQIIEYKGLVGDPSDNYPGVPGIGPKTAVDLLNRYKTIPNLYKHLKDLPEGLSQKLTEGKQLAELSRKLATIVTEVPISLDFEKSRFVFDEEKKQKIASKFQEMGFKSLAARLMPQKEAKKVKNKKSEKGDSQQELF